MKDGPRPTFSFSTASFLCALMGVGVVLLLGIARLGERGAGAYDAGYLAGSVIGLILLSLLVAYIAFRCSGRSHRGTNIAFMVAVLLVVAGQVSRTTNRDDDRAEFDALHERSTARRNASVREVQEKGYQDDAKGRADAGIADLEATARRLSGGNAKVAEAAATLARKVRDVSLPTNDALKAYVEAGGLDPRTLLTVAQIERRRVLLDRYAKASGATLAFLRTVDAEIAAAVSDAGVKKRDQPKVVQGMTAGMNIGPALRLLEEDERFIPFARQYLDSLKEFQGKWVVGVNGIEFNPGVPADRVRQVRDLESTINEIVAREEELIKELGR